MRPEDRQTYLSLFLTNFNAAVTGVASAFLGGGLALLRQSRP